MNSTGAKESDEVDDEEKEEEEEAAGIGSSEDGWKTAVNSLNLRNGGREREKNWEMAEETAMWIMKGTTEMPGV